jgi:hypothetical protein
LFDPLKRPLEALSHYQEDLMGQCNQLSNKVAEIQLNQNSCLMNTGIGMTPSESVPLTSLSSLKNLPHANDTSVHFTHARVPKFWNIPHANVPEYISNFSAYREVPLSVLTKNVSPSGMSSTLPSSSQSSSLMSS